MPRKQLYYGPSKDDFITVETLIDELKYIECMKIYKAFDGLEELENALKPEALDKLKNIL